MTYPADFERDRYEGVAKDQYTEHVYKQGYAAALRDVIKMMVKEADDEDNVWMPWVDIRDYARDRGIDLDES